MTKRFTMVYGKYRDNLTNTEYDERLESWKICDLLNKYHEECKMYREDTLKAEKDKEELLEENEQLKKQLQRLYNYFYDWHSDEMEGNQFSEMWDNVKEDERWEND